MKTGRDNRMSRGVLSQQCVGISVKPEGFGRNCIAKGIVLPISVTEHPYIVSVFLEDRVESLPAICELLEPATAGNASDVQTVSVYGAVMVEQV